MLYACAPLPRRERGPEGEVRNVLFSQNSALITRYSVLGTVSSSCDIRGPSLLWIDGGNGDFLLGVEADKAKRVLGAQPADWT